MENEKKTYPEGHFVGKWMGIGMAIFSGLGVSLSIISGNEGLIGIGPALGMSVGLAIGTSIEEKYKKEGLIVKKSNSSQNRKVAIAIIILGIAVFLGIIFII